MHLRISFAKYKIHNFGPMEQRLQGNKKFKRSLGRAGMCRSQPARVDHKYKKKWARGRRKIFQGENLGHPHRRGARPLVANCWSPDFQRPMVENWL
jgi:hypothetical protein